MAELQGDVETVEEKRSARPGAPFLGRQAYRKESGDQPRRVDHSLIHPRDVLLHSLHSNCRQTKILVDRELGDSSQD